MNVPEQEPLVKQIQEFYGTGKPAVTTDVKEAAQQMIAERPHYGEVDLDLSAYVPESPDLDLGILYFHNESNPADRVVRVMSPDPARRDLFHRLTPKSDNPQVKQRISTWDQIQHNVMLNRETLGVVYETTYRFKSRQPLVIEGPPAVSKTFGEWVSSSVLELPYGRMPFSSGVDRDYIVGSLQPDLHRRGIYTIEEVLTNESVLDAIDFLQNKGSLDVNEHVFLRTVGTLLSLAEKGISLTDSRVVMAYDQIDNLLGMTLIEESKYGFVDSDLSLLAEFGGLLAMDELNTIEDDKAYNAILPYIEPDTRVIPMPSQRERGSIYKHPDFFPVAAINPPKVAGRSRLPGPFESRSDRLVLGEITPEYIKDILNFYFTGNDADSTIGGRRVKGRRDVKTHFRALEQMPYRDLVINSVANVHTALTEMLATGQIGKGWREGGSFQYDQRKISSVADKMIVELGNSFRVTPQGRIERDDINWAQVVRSALRTVYLQGAVPSRDNKSDFAKINALLEGQPIWRQLDSASKGHKTTMSSVNFGGKKGTIPTF